MLAQADSSEVVCFALDELSRDMNCAEIIEFLKGVEKKGIHEVNLQVLDRLKPSLIRCVNTPDLIEYVVGYINGLFERYPDLPTCEQICTLLDETIRDASGAPIKLFELAERFRSELVRRKGSRPERASYAQELAKAGKLTEAGRELDMLEVQGLDLLRSYKTSEGVASLRSCSSGSAFLLTTFGGGADIVDDRLQESSLSLRYKEPGLCGCPIPEPPYGCIIGHGTTTDVYDCNQQRVGGCSYDRPIQYIEAFVFGGVISWLAALNDGTIILDGLSLRSVSFSVPTCPVKLMGYAQENRTDVYVITLDGRLYRLQDLGATVRQAGQGQRLPVALPLVASIPGSPNVVDALPVQGPPESRGFLVLSPTSLYFLRQSNGGFTNKKIVQDEALSCLGLYSPGINQVPEAIVGTHLRNLLFVSLQGQTLRQVFLPDVPTAVQTTKGDRHGPRVLVGFARGDLNLYQLAGPDSLRELRRVCQIEDQYRRAWTEHNLQEKLTLIALAKGKELDRDEFAQ